MLIEATAIPDVFVITPKRHGDERGVFAEVFREDILHAHGVTIAWRQDNHVISRQRNVVRALHWQSPPHAQDKLIRVARGRVLDVAVDVRRGSPTYGRHVAVELSAENWRQLLVPVGFAHGYATLEPDCEVLYKVSARFAPECEGGLAWDDPELGIDWGVDPAHAILADKDRRWPRLRDLDSPFVYQPRA
jgi:dTDP-4-dehydrorhamnose 3,5-epimerase